METEKRKLQKDRILSGITRAIRPHAVTLVALVLLVILMSFAAPNFLTSGNIIDIIRINSIKGIMCIGMTFVLLTGGSTYL